MPTFFFDTSAVVKRYIAEPGTSWVRTLCDARESNSGERVNSIFISEITVVEAAAAFALLVRRGLISKQEGQDAENQYQIVRLTPPLVRAAAELTQHHPLKAYDAMQLAFGLHTNVLFRANDLALVFITADDTLLQAARAEGMATENPFDHSELDTAR